MDLGGLQEFRRRLAGDEGPLFQDWPISPEAREACRGNVAATLEALIALGPDATPDEAADVLRRCIERFNELDEGFICTIEREELCDLLYQVGELCGLDSEEEWVDEWRDW